MLSYVNILDLFFSTIYQKSIIENAIFFEVKANCNNSKDAQKEALLFLFEKELFKDKAVITIALNEDPFEFNSTNSLNNNFWEKWAELKDNESEDDTIEITVRIDKSKHKDNLIFVYNFPAFLYTLNQLNTLKLVEFFNSLFANNESQLFFCSEEIVQPFNTQSIYFIKTADQQSTFLKQDIDHRKTWEKINTVSHLSGIDKCIVLPEDFYITSRETFNKDLEKQFNKATLILLFAALFDFVFIQDDTVNLKLNGYKTISRSISIQDLKVDSLKYYFDIYQWVITNGSISDKIGLARNLISLNIDKIDGYTIDDSVFISIVSGYKVYEKQNVKQYIELRNKMSDQILSYSEKANKLVENFASGFQKTALAFVSLFSTIVIARVLSAHNFSNIFTLDATVLAFAFLSVSLVYFFVCRWEINQQKSRFIESYNNMKNRNEDLLTKDDINRILNNDKEFNIDLQFIKDKQKNYTLMWVGFIIIFSAIVLLLYAVHCIYNLQQQSLVILLLKNLF